MPAYLTVHFEFDRGDSSDLVRQFYAGLATAGAPFRGVFPWGCDSDMPLDAIVAWNQAKLAAGFRLGFTEDVSNDYRQILLELPPFSHTRVFLLLRADSVAFSLIVPEADVDDEGAAVLERLARSMWQTLHPRSVQTLGEYDSPVTHKALVRGARPSAALFALLPDRYPLGRCGPGDVSVPGGRRLPPAEPRWRPPSLPKED